MTTYDPRWDEAESEADRGEPWKPKEDSTHPNPLTIEAEGWVTFTHATYGETELLVGKDRDGKKWSILIKAILKKTLVEGVFEEFDEKQNAFVEKERLGRVEPGEVVSVKFLGEKEGAKYTYDNFNVVRKPARDDAPTGDHDTGDDEPPPYGDDDIPM